MKHFDFDVIVIGGGHAGAEAAHASARIGAKTCLITLSDSSIGVLSCNPAIGGLGKGHLVREIDALGGVMGRVADASGIQFRLLNRKKGPAVQGPRAQVDREVYRNAMHGETCRQENLSVVVGEVVDLIVDKSDVKGVVLADGSSLTCQSVVLTTGTFLRGVIHIGDKSRSGGRIGDKASVKLAKRIEDLGFSFGRLKTGTPPRLDGRTINWSSLEKQTGDHEPVMFSFLSGSPVINQVSCAISHTNESTHDIIRKNLDKSAMYGGHIDGIGPRYCPSIEDKIVRFAEKASHQIFLEPEGLSTNDVYPNGISTSLPIEIQKDYVRSIVGLEEVKIVQPGYAIEYDFCDPRGLDSRLAVRSMDGLFFAGQINGTTGYEEAAGQGLVAGSNAALASLGRDPVTFGRFNSYIGVMVDDLITRGVVEPYRMFTSRAEFRLSLRVDNADQRLTPLGKELGLVDEMRYRVFSSKLEKLTNARNFLDQRVYSPKQILDSGKSVNQDGVRRSSFQLLSIPGFSFSDLEKLDPGFAEIDLKTKAQLSNEALYSNYIDRQLKEVLAIQRDEAHRIPRGFDFSSIEGLSSELKGKLSISRPENLSQAGRIDGMTPAALTLILVNLRKIGGMSQNG